MNLQRSQKINFFFLEIQQKQLKSQAWSLYGVPATDPDFKNQIFLYSIVEYGPGSIEKLLYEVWTWYISLSWITC